MQHYVDQLKRDRIKDSMRKIYYSAWKQFNEFFIRLDSKPNTWEERIILFVGFMVEQKRQSQTIKMYLSAIRAVLREDGVILNEDTYLLKSLTKACKYKNDCVRTRMPIQKSMLKVLLTRLMNILGMTETKNIWLLCTRHYSQLRILDCFKWVN